jgi:hypothetical protein
LARGITLLQASLLFTLLLAVSLGVLFSLYQSRLVGARLASEAQQLADMLASRASLASLGNIVPVDLPASLEGRPYSVECRGNEFVVRLERREFSAVIGTRIAPRPLEPGTRVYLCPTSAGVVISDRPPTEHLEELPPASENRPAFYDFSKNNPEVSACALWCYFLLGKEAVQCSENGNVLKAGDSFLEPAADNEGENVQAWVVRGMRQAPTPSALKNLPSVGEAENSGWLLSPQRALEEVKEREWRDAENRVVTVPENASILPCVVSTSVGRFLAWRVAWEDYIVYTRALLWSWGENLNSPGFAYFSASLHLG